MRAAPGRRSRCRRAGSGRSTASGRRRRRGRRAGGRRASSRAAPAGPARRRANRSPPPGSGPCPGTRRRRASGTWPGAPRERPAARAGPRCNLEKVLVVEGERASAPRRPRPRAAQAVDGEPVAGLPPGGDERRGGVARELGHEAFTRAGPVGFAPHHLGRSRGAAQRR